MTVGSGGDGDLISVIVEGPTHSGQEPRPLTQSHPKLWMGRTGWAFRKPGPCLRLWHVAHPALLAPASLGTEWGAGACSRSKSCSLAALTAS